MPFKPCPFGSGLRKFSLDPVVVIFFKNAKKFTTTGSSHFLSPNGQGFTAWKHEERNRHKDRQMYLIKLQGDA